MSPLIRKKAHDGPVFFPFYVTLLAVFCLMVFALAAGLTWYQYRKSVDRTTISAQRLMRHITSNRAERLSGLIRSVDLLVNSSSEMAAHFDTPFLSASPLTGIFCEILDSMPHLYGCFIGYDNGDFFQVVQLSLMDAARKQHLGAPEQAQFAVRLIRRSDDRSMQTWTFLNPDRQPLLTTKAESATYDPRTRPWYAADSSESLLGELYVFESTKAPGYTISRRFEGRTNGVVGMDITLSELSTWITLQKMSPSEKTVVFNQKGRLIAYGNRDVVQPVRDNSTELEFINASDLNDPVLTRLIEKAGYPSEQTDVMFRVNGIDYASSMTPLALTRERLVYVAMIVPTSEILGPVVKSMHESVLISSIFLLAYFPIVFYVSWRISRPLRRLAREVDHIRQFDLDPRPSISSRIREIHDLSNSMSTMKTGIRNFARYVPKALVKQLVLSGQGQQLGGERRVLSIMFTDVQRFTDLAETMTPEDLLLKMSAYLESVCEVILNNGGTIDKFIGDGIMAFWNAPLLNASHERDACRTMLLCRNKTRELNASWQADGLPVMYTRFGLHTGDTIVGNIGSADRMEYTALGASVNLASRLEGLNKHYGTQLLVSEAVVGEAGDDFLFRSIDRVRPKGTTHPINIFELINPFDKIDSIQATDREKVLCERWEPIYRNYFERRWPAVKTALERFIKDYPDDRPAHLLLARTERYLEHPPGEDWDGAEIYLQK